MLAADHGTRSLRDLLGYAEGYARSGHPFLPRAADTVAMMEPMFRDHWPTSAARWLAHGRPPRAWEIVTNAAHADVLARLVKEGEAAGTDRTSQFEAARRAWREGFVAEAVDAFQRRPFRDSSGGDHAGLVTAGDMAAWRASYEPAAVHRFRDVEVAKTGTWGQGPVLLQALAMLDGMPAEALDPSTVDGVHAVTEVMKLAFADREAWYGDDSPVTLAQLLDPAYVASRRDLVGALASAELRPGAPGGRTPRLPGHVHLAAGLESGERAGRADGLLGGGDPGGHLSHRRRRPWGQHHLRDPERRVAAELADRARARVLPGQPDADVLAGRRAAVLVEPGAAPADHALADARAARRTAGAGLRHSRW